MSSISVTNSLEKKSIETSPDSDLEDLDLELEGLLDAADKLSESQSREKKQTEAEDTHMSTVNDKVDTHQSPTTSKKRKLLEPELPESKSGGSTSQEQSEGNTRNAQLREHLAKLSNLEGMEFLETIQEQTQSSPVTFWQENELVPDPDSDDEGSFFKARQPQSIV